MNFVDMYKEAKNTLRLKFVNDTIWTLASNVVLGVSGIIINTVLVGAYNQEQFGQFALAFAIYMLVHMIAIMGISNSVIKHVSGCGDNPRDINGLITAALLLVLGFSIGLSIFCWIAAPGMKLVYKSPQMIAVFRVFLLGLPAFSANKVLTGHLNGLRDMKAYAVFQAARYILILLGILTVSAWGGSILACAWSVPVTEAILFIGLLGRSGVVKRLSLAAAAPWYRRHIRFGLLTSLHDIGGELYYRVDLLIVGCFSPATLGLYAYASDVAKGLTAFSILVQVNFNPVISKMWTTREVTGLAGYIGRVRRHTYWMYLVILLLAACAYPVFIQWFKPEMFVQQHLVAFYILLVGVCAFSGYSAIAGVMAYTGHLNCQIRRSFLALAVNTVGSLTLVPLIGIIGAAASTLTTFLLVAGHTHLFIRRRLEIYLWP